MPLGMFPFIRKYQTDSDTAYHKIMFGCVDSNKFKPPPTYE